MCVYRGVVGILVFTPARSFFFYYCSVKKQNTKNQNPLLFEIFHLSFCFLLYRVFLPVWNPVSCEADVKRARRHAQTTFLTTLPPYPVTYRSPTPTSRLTPTPPSISVCHEHEPTTVSRPATRATGSGDEMSSRLLAVPVSPATSSTLQPSPTASRRISSGSTLLASATASIDSTAGTMCGASVHASLASILSSVDSHQQQRPPSPDELTADGHQHSGKEREAINSGCAATKKRKMPIINPLVTLPMWPSKL